MVKRVFLIRHGETDWNIQRRWQGQEPTLLNDAGLAQARALGQYLRDRPITAIYSSDLPRALQTAQAVADILRLQVLTDVRWRELNVGIFQGMRGDEAREKHADSMAAWYSGDPDFVIPGGESRVMLAQRARLAWDEAVGQAEGPEIAIVSHGGTIRHLLSNLFPGEQDFESVSIENTSITTIEHGSGWRLAGLGEIAHLAALRRTSETGDDSHPVQ